MIIKVKTEIIDNYRKENKLTVEQFCKKCNIAKNAYYKFMNNQLDKVNSSRPKNATFKQKALSVI